MSDLVSVVSVIPLRGLAILPRTMVHFDISRDPSIAAARKAMMSGEDIFLVAQKDQMVESPGFDDIYKIGTLAIVKQLNKLPDGIVRVMVEAKESARILSFEDNGEYYEGEIQKKEETQKSLTENQEEAFVRELRDTALEYEKITGEAILEGINSQSFTLGLEDVMLQIMMRVKADFKTKQEYLEADGVLDRFGVVSGFLQRENEIGKIRSQLVQKVKERLDENQREHILREQIDVIREELGDDYMSDADELEGRIKDLQAEDYVKEKLLKELSHYRSLEGNNVEGNVVRTYIETMLELPWNVVTEENPDLDNAQNILKRDHYGLEKVKERILEFLAVRALSSDGNNNPIICLVGPPGTGKTSIVRSVAEALNRKYVRICLGGVDDEAEIRGHRKTYVGAMPGRIVSGLRQAKSANPLILLDEIDKLGRSMQGDPSSALLEVLDSEQNSHFRDNYIEVPIDLSKVMFIATANDISTIPEPLVDRMEIIEVDGYTENEKFHIAKEHLIEKQYKNSGIKKSQLAINDDAIYDIILYYTREAGVRQLEREISHVFRKAARRIVQDGKKNLKVSSKNIGKYLGRRKYHIDMANKTDEVGIVRGLAWTTAGGTTLQVEVNTMPGKGTLMLTGQLGDVMKESAQTALSYVRTVALEYGVGKEFFAENDIHVHVPEGAVPKDGPSAGITMATGILSAVSNIPVKRSVAMTGEINLRGGVMPIGGIKEKLLAAKNAGVSTVLVPKENEPEVSELSDEITGGIDIIFVTKMSEVTDRAFVKKREHS